MTFGTDRYIPLIEVPDQIHGIHRFYRTLLKGDAKQIMDQLKVLLPDTPCQEPSVSDPGKPGRQDVHQEPADEFFRSEFLGFPCIGRTIIILVTEPDDLVVVAFDTAVGNGCPVCISGEVRDRIVGVFAFGILRTSRRGKGFDLYVPFFAVTGVQKFLPCIGIPVCKGIMGKVEPAVIPELLQSVHELSAEHPVQCLDRQKKPV